MNKIIINIFQINFCSSQLCCPPIISEMKITRQITGSRIPYRPKICTDEDEENLSAEAAAIAICENMESEPQVLVELLAKSFQ
jgi:hypothetical protein